MLTHLIKSINWIDAALVLLFIRMIFVGVKNGFISELFKIIGVVAAVFVSLHYYTFIAAWVAMKTKTIWDYWGLVIFAGLWFGILLIFKLLREGIVFLFKIETNHEGFDKYASGIVAVGRGILVCSLTIFLILLLHNGFMTRMTLRSYSFKIAGHAAVGTYSFLYSHLFDKLFTSAHYNAAVTEVLHPVGR